MDLQEREGVVLGAQGLQARAFREGPRELHESLQEPDLRSPLRRITSSCASREPRPARPDIYFNTRSILVCANARKLLITRSQISHKNDHIDSVTTRGDPSACAFENMTFVRLE